MKLMGTLANRLYVNFLLQKKRLIFLTIFLTFSGCVSKTTSDPNLESTPFRPPDATTPGSGAASEIWSPTGINRGSTMFPSPSVPYSDGAPNSYHEIVIILRDNAGRPLIGISPQFRAIGTDEYLNVYETCSPSDGNGTSYCRLRSFRQEFKRLAVTYPEYFETDNRVEFEHGLDHHSKRL